MDIQSDVTVELQQRFVYDIVDATLYKNSLQHE